LALITAIQNAKDPQSAAVLQGSGVQTQQLQSILAKFQVGGGQAVSVDGAERGLALITAIQNAKDPQSAAAVLMAAVAGNAASATSLNKSGSSNLLVANGLYGDLSLADALAQTALTGGSAASGSHLTGLGAPGDSLAEAQAALISNTSGLASAVRKSESSAEDGPDFTDSRGTEDAHRQRLESVDAMLSVSASDAQQGLVQLQQSMASQPLGKAAIANANALEGSVSWLASQRGGSATIDLTPPDLGSLRLELKIDAAGESAVLVVHAANESAKAAIEQSLDRLYESFQHAGMSLQVSIGGSSTGFSSAFANEFSADQGGASGTAQQRVEGRSNALAGVTTLATKVQDGLSLYV
jgi:flagellar hook-length control protein FliK